jgi:cold shock CspA family protein
LISFSLDGLFFGTVTAYDNARGTGTAALEGTEETYAFHCTAIADGSREIQPATRIAFLLRAGQLGRLEAVVVTPLSDNPGPLRPGRP